MVTFMLLSSRARRRGRDASGISRPQPGYDGKTPRARFRLTFPWSPAGDEFGDGRPSRLGTPMGGDRVMSHDPQLQDRPAQHYAGIRTTVPMDGISGAVDEAFPELFGWLAGNGI